MFFQINITPKEKKVSEPITRSQVNNDYSLLLAPFQPPTRIKLDTTLNKPIECTLTIKNSNNRSLTASITKIPPQERCISLSATEWSIQPESNVSLVIRWEPKESGTWRDILQLSDSRRLKYDIPLTLSCTDPNKGANGKGGKGKQQNPLGSKINSASNVKKNLASQKTTLSNVTKPIVSKSKVQPVVKKVKTETNKRSNKENFSNNLDFNWMIDQAKAKKQKRENSPPPPLDFSKILDSSSFKFTPLKPKFTCFESTTLQDTIAFDSTQDNHNINKNTNSLLLKQGSITVEKKVQMTLRKETYVKIPKRLNNQSNLDDSQELSITEDKVNEEFDDSLSPKPIEMLNEKPQSDISMMLNNIKFTPFKSADAKNDNDLKFSPNCSIETKSDKSKLTGEDSINHSSKNATFNIDTISNAEGNNTYELPTSPTSTKNSFCFKPMCLAKTFDKNDLDIGFSTPRPVNNQCNATTDFPRFSNQFSKSQLDFGSAKDCVEADLWVKSRNPSLSPIAKNLMHSTLDSIREEDIHSDEYVERTHNQSVERTHNQSIERTHNQSIERTHNQSAEKSKKQSKKPKGFCIEISPPKKISNTKPPIRKVSPTKIGRITKEKSLSETVNSKKKVQINKSIKHDKSIQIPGVRIAKLSLSGLNKDKEKNNSKTVKKQPKEVSVKLHDPNEFLQMFCNPDPFAATMTLDPFLANTCYYDEKWIFIQELEFKKWLNALMTPPEHLTTDVESAPIDIGKVWQSCRGKEDVALAETKESVSARYHTNTRLNALRKAACAMFRKPEVITALSQTTVGIEKEILLIRNDKDLHRDIGLQKTILELFISYNPLWLRIGLETVYGETIPLQSNNDVIGLSRFLLNRFFSDPFLIKAHSSNAHPNIRLNTFQPLMNKFMLKKFLFVVYFLDYAKRNKLIGHDPCLFLKKALIKDSRSILLTFSRELLSGIGDITKVLRNYNYVVSHKQTYLDEYDYAVANLSTDLRDGVRLCRFMELITGNRCLTCRCRVPAISRLQKVHNVNIALTTLNEAGYTITGDIDAKSIADGHREKTLSLLWQIMYKFQRPRYEKAVKILQRWWRAKLWYINVKNMLRNRKHNAASVIQRAWRSHQARRKLQILKEEHTRQMQKKNEAAHKIQTYWRLRKQAKEQERQYQNTRLSVIKIQKCWRRYQSTKPYVKEFKTQRQLIINMQQRWRAKLLMKSERQRFIELKTNAIKIQRFWRAHSLGKQIHKDYQNKRAAIIFVQSKYKAKLLMRIEQKSYLQKLKAVKFIQEWWRRYSIFKRDRNYFISLKSAVQTVEKVWISKHTTTEERKQFLLQKSKAVIIQRAWRNYRATKEDVQLHRHKKLCVFKIQTWWRSVIALKKYKQKRLNCIKIQKWWRSIILTKKERSNYLVLKKCALTIQKNWRMKVARKNYVNKKNSVLKIELWYKNLVLSRMVRNEFLKTKAAVKVIEAWWIALKMGRNTKVQYTETKKAVIALQQRWRAQTAMKKARQEYLQMKNSSVKIQSWWRMIQEKQRHKERVRRNNAAIVLQCRWKAMKCGNKVRQTYVKKRCSIILIQNKWRAARLAKSERASFLKKRESVVTIQKYWRSYVAQKEYRRQKSAAIIIQKWRRHIIQGRRYRNEYNRFRQSVIKIQNQWRMLRQKTKYNKKRKAAIIIQKNWKMLKAMKEYQKKKIAVLFIENWRKRMLYGRQVRMEFIRLKTTVIKVQRLIRVKQMVNKFRKQRDAAIKIQRFWRSVLKMRECKALYMKQKAAVIVLQRRYRAKRLAVEVRKDYCHRILLTIRIQKWWRRIFYLRKLKMLVEKRKWAAEIIEHWWINSSEERRIREAKRAEFKRKVKAVIKIQAIWRGFKVRQTASKKMSILRERAKEASKAAVPTATLAFRLQENIEIFKYATNIGQLSVCLASLDVITRLSPNACVNVCQLNLVYKLYEILTRANRSLPWLDVCLKDISILLTLAKFKPTTEYVIKEEYIEVLARLLTISIDKKDDLFLHTATLIWVLTENYEYAEAVRNCSRTRYLLSSLYTSINKKLTRVATLASKSKGDNLPSPKPDWGLRRKRPRTFTNVAQAITSLASRLKILNLNQSSMEAQRSFSFSM